MYITKSNYIDYIQCRKLLWNRKNNKEIFPEISETKQAIFDQGNEVESYAQKLFPGGKEIKNNFQEGQQETKQHIENGEKILFQATAMVENLMVRSDILKYNEETKSWDIFEVKSSTEIKEEQHIPDLCFQKITLEKDGYKIGKTYLITVNSEYVRKGEIEPEKLFTINDISDQVENYRSTAEANIPKALKLITQAEDPTVEIGKQCKNPYECPLKNVCWNFLPEYSIYDLKKISESKIRTLKNLGILKITDIPDYFELTEAQTTQLQVAKTGTPIINKDTIADELNNLDYPLYFLDYETYNPAIPLFDGTRPYQQICFQYSLHVLKSQNSEVEHFEFLQTEQENPMKKLLSSLRQHIGETGSVIVWNRPFESGRNKEMAEQNPEHAAFLESLNNRMFDLMTIFRNRHYVHPQFRGSHSLKIVLPVLAPELSHSNLEEIQQGGIASLHWFKHVFKNSPEKDRTIKNLLEYCKLDTWAMVVIWKKLNELS